MRWALTLLLLQWLGCSKDVADLENQGYIKKSQFEGEWITHTTTVAKQSHNNFAFTGLSCPAERVKFVINKDQLLAFKSSNNDESNRDQSLVAAFNILEHADTDNLPWNKSRYIKVDWSKNLAPHIECNGWLSAITAVAIKHDVADPLEPYRLRVEENYMEDTVDAIVIPDRETCEEMEDWQCYPAEYRVKYSFKKVLPNDYEPWNYPDNERIRFSTTGEKICIDGEPGCKNTQELWLYEDHHQEVICDPLKHDIDECYAPSLALNANFGFFRTTEQNYDRKEGFNRREVKTWINRYNLWQKSFNEDGSLIPLAERLPKKITYYLNPGFPKELHDAVRKVEKEWNTAFSNVVAKTRDQCSVKNVMAYLKAEPKLAEKLSAAGIRTIGNYNIKDVCVKVFEWSKKLPADEVFFTGDPAEVEQIFGPIFEIRVNDCNEERVKKYAVEHDLLGVLEKYGQSEIKNVEKACALLEWAAKSQGLPPFKWQQPGDIRYSFVNGVENPDGNLLGYGPMVADPASGEIISATANIYLSAITEFAARSVDLMDDLEDLSVMPKETQGIDEFKEFVINTVGSMNESSYQMPKNKAFLLHNLDLASKLNVFPELKFDTLKSFSYEDFGIDSFLSSLAPKEKIKSNAKHNRMHQFFSERSACFFQPDEIPYSRLSEKLNGLSVQEKINAIKAEIFASTLAHELGHTFGLRHNFKAKSNAFNYPPNYYGVDTNDFRMRPELDQEEMSSSSTMDYHKRFNSDFFGLGLYDYAALLLGYAKKLEVFDTKEEDFVPTDFVESLQVMNHQDFPYLFAGKDANQKIKNHYLQVKDEFLRGKKSVYLQFDKIGIKPRPENIYKRNVVDYTQLKKQKLESSLGVKTKELTQVPYEFCTDGQARRNDIFCQPFIFGATASEIIENQIKDYELAHLMRRINHRPNQTGVNSYIHNLYSNIYAPILRSYQRMYVAADTTKMIFPAIHDYAVGAKRGLEFISETLQAVEPGEYCKNNQGDYELMRAGEKCLEPIEIDDAQGRKFKSSFNDDLVSSPKYVGFVYDKILALLALIDDKAVLGDEFSGWRRNTYSIGFYRIFAPQLMSLFSNIYTDQWANLAPHVEIDDLGQAQIKYRDLFIPKDQTVNHLPRIIPSYSSTLKDYAILLSMSGLSNPADHMLNFSKRAQISSTMASRFMTKEVGDEITFTDPNTQVRYHATASEDKDSSLGYKLLQDASRFISDDPNDMGPWFLAKADLTEAKKQLEQAVLARDKEKILGLRSESKKLSKDFYAMDRKLREKVRVIEKVQALSQKFD